METKKTYSLDKKMSFVEDYLSSGKSLRNWCSDHQISKSTFYGWLRKYEKSHSTVINDTSKFIEIKSNQAAKIDIKDTTPIAPISPVALCYKGFEFKISSSSDITLFKEVLKAVMELDV